jgi:soluble lytic murein transglycosylase-like protein
MKNVFSKCFILTALSVGATGAEARDHTEWDRKIEKIANREGVPAPLLAAICWVESAHRPHVTVWDDNGSASIGLCQIKLATARMMGFKGKIHDLYIGEVNAKYAAKYLKYQLDRYASDWHKSTAAYNAGSAILSKKHPGKLINEKYIDTVNDSVLE